MMTDKKTDTKKGFADVPLKKGKGKSDKVNAVENIPVELATAKMVSNCTETSNFLGRLMNDEKVSCETIIINTVDCAIAVEVSPEELWGFVREFNNMLLGSWSNRLTKKWGKKGIDFCPEDVEIGDIIK